MESEPLVLIDYVRAMNAFIEYATDERLTPSEVAVWLQLFYFFNRRAKANVWPSGFIGISNQVMLGRVGMSKATFLSTRNRLAQRGLIAVLAGKRNKEVPQYKLNYFFPQVVENICGKPVDNFTPEVEIPTEGKSWVNIQPKNYPKTYPKNYPKTYPKTQPKIDRDYTESKTESKPSEEDQMDDDTQPARAREAARLRGRAEIEAMDYHGTLRTLYPGVDGERMRRLIGSEYYPLSLVARAIRKTEERHRREALVSPLSYTLKLLEDWESRGWETDADVEAGLSARPQAAATE